MNPVLPVSSGIGFVVSSGAACANALGANVERARMSVMMASPRGAGNRWPRVRYVLFLFTPHQESTSSGSEIQLGRGLFKGQVKPVGCVPGLVSPNRFRQWFSLDCPFARADFATNLADFLSEAPSSIHRTTCGLVKISFTLPFWPNTC
jgi:hypothetical protein